MGAFGIGNGLRCFKMAKRYARTEAFHKEAGLLTKPKNTTESTKTEQPNRKERI